MENVQFSGECNSIVQYIHWTPLNRDTYLIASPKPTMHKYEHCILFLVIINPPFPYIFCYSSLFTF